MSISKFGSNASGNDSTPFGNDSSVGDQFNRFEAGSSTPAHDLGNPGFEVGISAPAHDVSTPGFEVGISAPTNDMGNSGSTLASARQPVMTRPSVAPATAC